MILLGASWRDLFLLSLAQCDIHLEVKTILECANIRKDQLSPEKMDAILSDIRYMRDLTNRFRHLGVDKTEYSCLKAVVIFRPGKCVTVLS